MRCHRHVLEVNWQDQISNNEVRQVQRERTVMDTIRQRKLQLLGHICRMPDDRLKSLVLGMVEGERQPGQPVRRWINDILMWCSQDVQKARLMTVDRDNWRRFVASPYGPCWPREWRRRSVVSRTVARAIAQQKMTKWDWRNQEHLAFQMQEKKCTFRIILRCMQAEDLSYCVFAIWIPT